MRGFHSLAVLAALLVLVASSASAQSSSGPDPLEVARNHMEQGQTFYLQGRFDEAAAEFELAYEAQHFSAFIFNAAVAYENAGHLAHGIQLFERYLELDPEATDEDEVRARIAHLRERVAARAAETAATASTVDSHAATPEGAAEGSQASEPEAAPTPTPTELPQDFKSLVNVRTEPMGATVRIVTSAGVVVDTGSSPVAQTLDAGTYHITIDHPDFNRAETDIQVEPGHVYLVQINLSQGEFAGYLRVVSDPPGASVFVDDHAAGTRGATPFEGTARVGAHHIWVERAGYDTVEQDVDVQLGRDAEASVTLERASVGRIRVIGNVRGAQIFVDDVPSGEIPWEGELRSGMHNVRVTAPGMKDWQQGVEIARGQLTPVRVRLAPAPGRGGAWVTGAFTAVLLAGGITMTVLANEWANQLAVERSHGTLASDDPRIQQGFAFSIAQYCGYGLAAILFGVTIYYAVQDDLPPSEATVLEPRDWAFMPLFDPTTGLVGLGAGGMF